MGQSGADNRPERPEADELIGIYGKRVIMLKTVAPIFLEETPAQIETLEQYVNAGDFSEIRKLAHLLIGSFGVFYAGGAIRVGKRLQNAARQEDLEDVRAIFSELPPEVDHLMRVARELDERFRRES